MTASLICYFLVSCLRKRIHYRNLHLFEKLQEYESKATTIFFLINEQMSAKFASFQASRDYHSFCNMYSICIPYLGLLLNYEIYSKAGKSRATLLLLLSVCVGCPATLTQVVSPAWPLPPWLPGLCVAMQTVPTLSTFASTFAVCLIAIHRSDLIICFSICWMDNTYLQKLTFPRGITTVWR